MKLYILPFIFMLSIFKMNAQSGGPTFNFSSAVVPTDSVFCVDVTVKDFTLLFDYVLPIKWDSTVLEFQGIAGIDNSILGLTQSDFDLSQVESGLMIANWKYQNQDCNDVVNALTIDDETVIFQMCFKMIGGFGSYTNIEVAYPSNQCKDCPVPSVFRKIPEESCKNITLNEVKGLVSNSIRAFEILAESKRVNSGDLVCVNYSVNNFTNIRGLQFSVSWDDAFLNFEEFIIPQENPLNIAAGTSINAQSDKFTFIFYDVTGAEDDQGRSLPDSTTLFQACYTVIQPCLSNNLQSTELHTLTESGQLEVINALNDSVAIAAVTMDGNIQVNECLPIGLQLNPQCGASVDLGDEVCVPFTSGDNFANIIRMSYLHSWNSNILEFVGISNINPALANADFSALNNLFQGNIENGYLGIDWNNSSQPVNISDGEVVYELCFKVIGLGGNSPIVTGGLNSVINSSDRSGNIYFNATNCQVTVNQPEKLIFTAEDSKLQVGQSDCIDVAVNNFEEIDSLNVSFYLDYGNAILDSVVLMEGLSGLEVIDLDILNGTFTLFYSQTGNSLSVPDNETIMSICYTMAPLANDCVPLLINPGVLPFASTLSSFGQNISVEEIQGGEICVTSAPGFELFFESKDVNFDDTICINTSVVDFDDISGSAFTVNWDPLSLDFISVEMGNYGGFNFDTNSTNTSLGILPVTFQTLMDQPLSIPNDSIIFSLCYNAIGTIGECSDISINEMPNPIVESNGTIVPLVYSSGGVCIQDVLKITQVEVNPVSCPGNSDGSISIDVEYYSLIPDVYWYRGNIVIPNQESDDPFTLVNVEEGSYIVLITNKIKGGDISILDTIEITISSDLPVVNAGEDDIIPCQKQYTLMGSVIGGSPDYNYSWSNLEGEILNPNGTSHSILQPGEYIFKATNSINQCVVSDTVQIIASAAPSIFAGSDQTIFCSDSSLTLTGSGISENGEDEISSFLWSSVPNTLLQNYSTQEKQSKSLDVTEAGTYIITGFNTTTGCSGKDTVVVEEGRIYPTVDGGMDTTIICGETITLNSDSSMANSDRGQLSIQWISVDSSLSYSNSLSVNQPGMVVLQVTDDFNQCASYDTIAINPAPDYPFLNFNFEAQDPNGIQLDCNTEDYRLVTTGFDPNLYDFNWNIDNPTGISSTATLSPTFTEGGNYTLTITQKANTLCSVSKTIEVTEDFDFPSVGISASSAIINCYHPEVTLSGIVDGAREDYAIKWFRQSSLIEEVMLDIEVVDAGDYRLEIIDVNTYCKADTTIFIDKNIEVPTIAAISIEETLDCIKEEVRLGILEPSPILLPAFQLDWTVPSQSNYNVDPTDSLAIFTTTPGIYTATLTNTVNGCSSLKDFEVIENREYPTAEINTPDILTCADSIVELRAAFSLEAASNKFTWDNLDPLGMAPQTGDGSITEVLEPGQYVLTVLNPTNQCISYDTVTVTQDIEQPQVQIATPEILTCTNNSVLLLATVTNVTGPYNSFWTGTEGQTIEPTENQDLVNVSEMGTFELRVVNSTNGCSSSSSVVVESDNNFPIASISQTVTLPCKGVPVTLTNEGSSEGDNFSYQWMIVSADGDLSNPTILEPSVTLPGRYALTVSNALNGCTAEDTVTVVLDPSLILAATGDDLKICEDTYELNANLPANTFGRWVPIGTPGVLLTPEEPSSKVQTLQEGANLFEWILSTASCADYSSDTINVFVAETPKASDDGTTLVDGTIEITLGLLDNDVYDSDFLSVAIFSNPIEGAVTLDPNGEVTYSVRSGFFGEDQFSYILCNEFCENLCDTASVFIDIPFDPNFEAPPLPNAITPNGDGLNDAFVFEILENPDKIYPDNEFIVFNRWGDIVYTQRPYDNNWRGTAADGSELPHGTYYYVLRLDISEGIILKGDVTVIKKN